MDRSTTNTTHTPTSKNWSDNTHTTCANTNKSTNVNIPLTTSIDTNSSFQWLYQSQLAKKMPMRLTQRIQYMIEQSIMQGTSRTYNSAHKHYVNFCNQFQLPYWPKEQQQMELQLMYWHALRLEQVKASTLRSQYHGVKHGAAIAGRPISDKFMFMLHRQRQSLTNTFVAQSKDIRKPFTEQMLQDGSKYFNFYNCNDLVYFTALTCNIVALMQSSKIYAKNQQVHPSKTERPSAQALYMRNITPALDQHQIPEYYTCTCRATKTDKAKVDVDVV